MGIDYRTWVIPKQRTFRPRSDQIAALANALRGGKWVPMPDADGQRSRVIELLPSNDSMGERPTREESFTKDPFSAGWIEFHGHHELVLAWWVNDSAKAEVRFPMNFIPYPDSPATYFGIRLIAGPELFCYTGENVMPFADTDTKCSCGEQLARWTAWTEGTPSERIKPRCTSCGYLFDVSAIACEILDGWTGESHSLPGGLTFHFALQIDCHKNWPNDEKLFSAYRPHGELLALWSKHIDVPYEVIVTVD